MGLRVESGELEVDESTTILQNFSSCYFLFENIRSQTWFYKKNINYYFLYFKINYRK